MSALSVAINVAREIVRGVALAALRSAETPEGLRKARDLLARGFMDEEVVAALDESATRIARLRIEPSDPPPELGHEPADGRCYRWLAWATKGATQLPWEEILRRWDRGEEPPTEPMTAVGPRPIGSASAGGAR